MPGARGEGETEMDDDKASALKLIPICSEMQADRPLEVVLGGHVLGTWEDDQVASCDDLGRGGQQASSAGAHSWGTMETMLEREAFFSTQLWALLFF